MSDIPDTLALIAGRGDYPLLLGRAARAAGVRRIIALTFRGETRRAVAAEADRTYRLHAGSLGGLLQALQESGARHAVMAGQINPKNLFFMRLDRELTDLLKRLPMKNAHTIFGGIVAAIEKTGIHLLPAATFMQAYMPSSGVLTVRAPTERERRDAAIGRRVIQETGHLDIGQTVVVKEGMVLAVEAFEGTDRAIRRGGRLGGKGAVVVKVPRAGHDMRFDIPVIGKKTLHSLRKAGCSCLALQEYGAILLDREALTARADAAGLAVTVLDAASENQGGGRRPVQAE